MEGLPSTQPATTPRTPSSGFAAFPHPWRRRGGPSRRRRAEGETPPPTVKPPRQGAKGCYPSRGPQQALRTDGLEHILERRKLMIENPAIAFQPELPGDEKDKRVKTGLQMLRKEDSRRRPPVLKIGTPRWRDGSPSRDC
uniref:Uncharacterized protein n=1 Tax=Oryza brachyantha TaxID=4533 RepID=J3LES1_ORYBR